MARLAATAWAAAAVATAALTSYLVSRDPGPCGAGVASCPVLVAEVTRAFLWPAWAALIVPAYLLARRPTALRALLAALVGLIGGPLAMVVIAELGESTLGGPGWTMRSIAFGALLVIPGIISALAAHELGARHRTRGPMTRPSARAA